MKNTGRLGPTKADWGKTWSFLALSWAEHEPTWANLGITCGMMRNDGLSSCPSTLRPMIATYRNKEIPRKAALIGAGGVLAGELRMGRAGLNHCAETLTVAFGPTWRNLGTLECKLDFTYATWSCVVGATEAEVKPSQKIKNGGKKAGFQLLALSLKLARSPSYPQRGPTWAQVDAMLCTCRSKSGPT